VLSKVLRVAGIKAIRMVAAILVRGHVLNNQPEVQHHGNVTVNRVTTKTPPPPLLGLNATTARTTTRTARLLAVPLAQHHGSNSLHHLLQAATMVMVATQAMIKVATTPEHHRQHRQGYPTSFSSTVNRVLHLLHRAMFLLLPRQLPGIMHRLHHPETCLLLRHHLR
jgi:hypothetical protein